MLLTCTLKTEDGNSGDDLAEQRPLPSSALSLAFFCSQDSLPLSLCICFFLCSSSVGFIFPLFFCVSSQSSFFLHPPVFFPCFSLFGWFASVFSSSSAFLFWFLGSLFPPLSCASLLRLL